MKRFFLLMFILFALAGLCPSAFATPILSIHGGTSGVIPGSAAGSPNNNLLPGIYGTDSVGGYYGAEVKITGTGYVTFEYLGSEAGFTNNFFYESELLFANKGADGVPVGTTESFFIDTGVTTDTLDFFFAVVNTGSVAWNGIFNPDGSTAATSTQANFFVALDLDNTSLILFLDDDPSRDDDNHDDMAIRISVAPVPEPATMMLFGIGLLGIAGVSRKRK